MGAETKVNPKRVLLATALAATIFIPAAFTRCSFTHAPTASEPEPGPGAKGTVSATILLGKVGVLAKPAAINLQKLILVAVSSAVPPDTVRDTVGVSGNAAISLTRALTLPPLRTWTVSARSLDAKDSVIHSGATAPFFLKPADTAFVSLNLASRFAMYQANFNSLPDSIASAAAGTAKDKLNLNRILLRVDGAIQADSSLASGYFNAGANLSLYFDYMTPGTHTLTLEAYGNLHAYSGLLYLGTVTLSVTAGIDDTRAVTLNWVGPTTGTGKLTVVIGKVGKVIVNGTMPGTVL